jgi:hypothetical protein
VRISNPVAAELYRQYIYPVVSPAWANALVQVLRAVIVSGRVDFGEDTFTGPPRTCIR